MARLPGVLDVGAPRGARASGRTADVDFSGLQDIAQGIEAVGEAFARRDDRKAEKIIREKQAEYETGFAERSAAYDGAEPGYANAEAGHFETWAKSLTEAEGVSGGVRYALKRRLDDMRGKAAQRAIGVEAQTRGEIIAEQRRAVKAANISGGVLEFQDLYSQAYEALTNEYDGSSRDFADRAGKLADEAMAKALENVAEADRPDFQARIAGMRPSLQAQALAYEQNKSQAYVVDKVKTARERTLNSVIGNPEAFALADANAEALLDGLPKAIRPAMLKEYRGDLAAGRVQGLILRGDISTATEELESGRYDDVLDPRQKLQLVEAVKTRSARLAGDLIEALRYGDDVDPEALQRAAKDSGDPGLAAKADFALTVGALEGEALGSLGGGSAKTKGFAEAATFVIDELEGGEGNIRNDNGRGLSRFGINQAANPDIDVSKITRAGAVNRYKRYWAAVGASSLPPGMAMAAFDAAVLFGPDDARKWLAESGGDVGAFLAMEQAEMRRLAKENPAKYGDDLKGWLNRVEKVRAEAARRQAFANVQDGLSSDPLKFALGGSGRAPLANVPALPDQPGGPAFRAALQGRLQVGLMMQKQYRAPLRLLTNAEAAFYKDAIERDPLAAVDFAREATAAVGPQAARSMLGEVGKQGQAGVTLHLADLSAAGLDTFADTAARGLALKGQGQALERARLDTIRAELEAVSGVFAGMPELRAAAFQTAEAAMLADVQSGEAKPASFYVKGALGASTRGGKVFGGTTRLNGVDTLIPSWLGRDRADDALDVMAEAWAATGRGPVWTDGTKVDAGDLRKSRLRLLPNGRYLLMDSRGRAYQAKGGQPFSFDWDDAKDALRTRLGAEWVAR